MPCYETQHITLVVTLAPDKDKSPSRLSILPRNVVWPGTKHMLGLKYVLTHCGLVTPYDFRHVGKTCSDTVRHNADILPIWPNEHVYMIFFYSKPFNKGNLFEHVVCKMIAFSQSVKQDAAPNHTDTNHSWNIKFYSVVNCFYQHIET